MLETNFKQLYENLKPMLSENEIEEFTKFVNSIGENVPKNEGKHLIITYLKDLVSKKVEEEGVKLIKYYEDKMRENEKEVKIYD